MASGLSISPKDRFTNTLARSWQSVALIVLISSLMGTISLRLAYLQFVRGHEYRQRAEMNRIRLVPVASDRGNILDRKGKLLAANRLTRSLYLWPQEQSPEQWQIAAERLANILKVPAGKILAKLEETGYQSPLPVRVGRDLNPEAFIALAESAVQLPGTEIRGESSRYYPAGSLAAHFMGYIGEATAEDMDSHPEFPMGMIVGRTGIEHLADERLRGVWGSRLIEVDAAGQELRMLGMHPPDAGSPVKVTLDLKLQKAAEKALDNRRGSVVALDVKTGAILVIASGPTFDPNVFTHKITQKDWQQLQGKDNPLLNRALQGYPPASTFKIVTAVAGIESGKMTPTSRLATAAALNIGGTIFREHSGGYGVIGFQDALAYSSNTFFYQVGMKAGPEEIAKWGKRMGIGTSRILGWEGGNRGSIPTPAEKQELYKQPWYAGDTVSMSIGQGVVLVTPLELAVMVATIANGGWRVKPHLLADQTNIPETKREKAGISPGTLKTVRDGLIAVVQRGTARRLNDGSIPLVAGKTGTAEVPGQRDNAVFVSFGPAKDPQIAIAVVVENGGYGGATAAPIAHKIYKEYFKNKG